MPACSRSPARPLAGGSDFESEQPAAYGCGQAGALSTTPFAYRTGSFNGDLMDFYTATQQAIGSVDAASTPDSDPVWAGLQLAIHAWQTCQPQPVTATGWAMFGNGVCAAVDELGQPPEPFVVVADLPVPDTAQVREQTAALTAALSAHLEVAAGDPRHAPDRRWAWAAAAARLRTAASDLLDWP
jgi:hypothetical protein